MTVRESRSDRVFSILNYTLLGLGTIVILFPLIYVISSSFSSASAVIQGRVWLYPVKATLAGYKAVFADNDVWMGFVNSIFYTVVGTVVNIVMTLLAAYPLSRDDLYGKKLIVFLFVFTMLFSGGLIPTFLVVKDLGMVNTRWALIFPEAMIVWYVIIARTYLKITIPKELFEAAQVDGCNDFRFLVRVVIPLSGPIIAVLGLFYAVDHWNEYFQALIYLNSQKLFPLQLVLQQILVANQVSQQMLGDLTNQIAIQNLSAILKYALIVVSSVPVLILYPFVQRHFVKGIMIGSLKG